MLTDKQVNDVVRVQADAVRWAERVIPSEVEAYREAAKRYPVNPAFQSRFVTTALSVFYERSEP
jgi:hypothetical protein